MYYLLKENLTGNATKFETKLHISETEKDYVFFFEAKDSTFYCPYKGYNENHYEGDVCEVFIGNVDTPREYYEIEITPDGAIFLAKVYNKSTETTKSLELIYLENDLIKVETQKFEKDYTVKISISKEKLNIPLEKIAFNAFRIETEGIRQDMNDLSLIPTKDETFHKLGFFVMLKDYLK